MLKKQIDLHKCKLRLQQAKVRLADRYSEANADTTCRFLARLRMNNLSYGRIANYAECTIRLLGIKDDKPIEKWTKQDIESVHTAIADLEYANSVKKDTLTTLKRLYHYAVHDDIADASKNKKPYDDTVSWITPGSFVDRYSKIQSKDLLTEAELLALVGAVKEAGGRHLKRDIAIIFLLLEGAYRPSELLLLRIGGIEFMENYVRVHTEVGKTGAKSLTLVASFVPIKEWLAEHPHADDPDAFFCYDENDDGLLEYRRFAEIIAKARVKAKIKKRVWPYLFRHTALTEYSKRLGNIAKIYGNWSQKSNMLARYEHLANSDQEQAALQLHGLKPKKETMSILFSKICPVCKTVNSSDKAHCTNCGQELAKRLVAQRQKKIESKKAEEQRHLETKYSDKLESLEKMILTQQQQLEKRDALIEKILAENTVA